MPLCTLHFQSSDGSPPSEAHTFEAETEHRAKVKTAMLYAGASVQTVPPTACRLLGPSGDVAHCYPEE